MNIIDYEFAFLLVAVIIVLRLFRQTRWSSMQEDMRREVRIQHKSCHRETTEALAQARSEIEELKTMIEKLRADVVDDR